MLMIGEHISFPKEVTWEPRLYLNHSGISNTRLLRVWQRYSVNGWQGIVMVGGQRNEQHAQNTVNCGLLSC